jgi:flavin reductase (DIM6/NTAB) family NADH-FMN oxidoreductase RutF/DNA-binding MarR family transcriptional regulator
MSAVSELRTEIRGGVQGLPSEDIAAFRRCLSQFGTGVTVVTTRSGDELAGMTSNSFASVSLDPPLILWSIRKSSTSYSLFEKTTHFAVNILASTQVDLSQKFAKTGPDKFNDVDWSAGLGGAPVLDGTVAIFECRAIQNHDGGDHLIMVGEVERFTRYSDREPLLFVQGRYAMPIDHPQSVLSRPQPATDRDYGPDAQSLSSLLLRASTAVGPIVASARQTKSISSMEARVLRGVRVFPGRTLPELVREVLLGLNSSEVALDNLLERRLIAAGPKGELTLTPEGEACFTAVLSEVRRLENQALSDVSAGDVAATRRVLSKLALDMSQ